MKNIKKRVKNLIKKYGTKNPYKLCKYLKIEIFYMDLGRVKGIYKKTLTNKFIIINENLSEFSQMIVLVHELGHAVLHNSKEIQALKEYDLFPKYTNKIELEANMFTSEFMYDENIEDYEYDLDVDMKILKQLRELRNL
ncbi:MAG: ImmA/IrrE family metallo-endopeptidase [Bacteroidaceae bacterium]|uniref:ImmA/IrrE family metallo-endopeptidase n=1 Tax=Fusobacterium varium TaxID=856 RepID=UPI0024331AB6|nr:ImmA/IrrE family metallo-endopeptidase [Fusobacterium varium]MCF0171607.1 ImmA/IrrE family metallo-endopeptidase [Fusobacterium varium]MCF0189320.1 ImmA/IrrE family metallo-endopeptidase [Bacteroidaceae bacterium]